MSSNQDEFHIVTHLVNEKGLQELSDFSDNLAKCVQQCILLMGDGIDKAIFKTKIEEAVFFGKRAIAEKPENIKQKIYFPSKKPI
ncbi:MAG: hypothetical protein EB127_20650 [Alphaproteobacteria bacterium]|jgi:hypothetical protein|nr:hypothetical protein [Alphaproteobacteria bacterium]